MTFTRDQLQTIITLMEREIDCFRMYQYGNDEIDHFGRIIQTAESMMIEKPLIMDALAVMERAVIEAE